MKKLFKFIVYLIVILILLVVIAAVLVGTLVDPNKFKGQISNWVSKETGRTLVINGSIDHSFFPWLGLKVHDITISNASGFTPDHFLQVGEADVQVKLLPLAKGEVEIGKITLKSAELNLAKNASGQTNWDDLINKQEKEPSQASTTPSAPSAESKFFKSFSIAGVDVKNTSVNWSDQQNNTNIKLTNLSLNTDNILPGKSVPVSMKFTVTGLPDHLSGEYAFDSGILADTKNNLYILDSLRFTSTGSSSAMPNATLSANKVSFDLPNQTLEVTNFKVAADQLEANGDIHIEQIIDAPVYTGTLAVKSSNLRSFLKAIGKEVQTQDSSVLKNFDLSTNFRGTQNSIRLDSINMHLDDSTIKGNANISNFKPLAINFNQSVDQLNIDRYQPPQDTKANDSTKATAETEPKVSIQTNPSATFDFKSLRGITVGGTLNVSSLIIGGIELSQAHVQLLLQNGVLKISPFTANLLGGKTQTQLTANFQGNTPQYVINQDLSNIDLAQLSGSDRLVGLANIKSQLTTQGMDKNNIMQNLNGAVQFDIQKGVLKGVNIPYEIDRALALVKKQTPPAQPADNQTSFNKFEGTGLIDKGVFNNHDLLVQSPTFKMTGQGTANLISQKIDYRLRVVGMQMANNEQGENVEQERQTEIPLVVSGTFEKPIVTPDVSAIARMLLKEKVQDTVDKNFQDAKEKAGELFQRLLQ